MTRALVTACNLKFAEGARGMLASARRFHPEVVRYCIAPAADADGVRAALGDLATVVTAPRLVAGVPDEMLMQLYVVRLFLPTFPEEVVAWVDCDVAFRGPAGALWDVPPGRVNVVRDAVYNLGRMVAPDVWPAYAALFRVAPTDPGFNAGVFALRRADWPDLIDRYERAVVAGRFPYYLLGFDQALINGLLLPHANWLPRAFNAHALFELGTASDDRVLHYTDSPKPWMPGYRRHWPGYADWAEFAEQCGPLRAKLLRLYYTANFPRRTGYKLARKVLTVLGLWSHRVGVADAKTLRDPPSTP